MNLGGMKSWQSAIYIIVLIASFLCFQQNDLVHTFLSCYAYLGGHFSDFYDYNKPIMGQNDYLPLLYIIFAVWNLPLLLLGMIPPPDQFPIADLRIHLAWSKLLLVVFFIGSAITLQKIAQIVIERGGIIQKQPVTAIFLTAPLAIFPIFLFGQYDIIGVFFTLLGFYFYLKKDLVRFAIFFSIAISFKYFALAAYLPLVLMIERRPIHVIKWLVIGMLAVVIQHAMYWHSEVFVGQIFWLIKLKLAGDQGKNISWKMPTIYLMSLYAIGIAYLYFKKYTSDREWMRDAVFVPLIACGLMFGSVMWHPQWMVVATPFFALSYLYIKNTKLFVYTDLLAMVAFLWLCVNIWPDNVDVSMLRSSILRTWFPTDIWGGATFLIRPLVRPMRLFFYFYFLFPFFLVLWERYRKKPVLQNEMTPNLLFTRFIVGSGMFLVLALICAVAPIAFA